MVEGNKIVIRKEAQTEVDQGHTKMSILSCGSESPTLRKYVFLFSILEQLFPSLLETYCIVLEDHRNVVTIFSLKGRDAVKCQTD